MADIQSPEILKCYIHRFGISLSFKDITSIKICQSQRYISIEKENSLLEIIKLDTKQNNVKPVEIESVKQYGYFDSLSIKFWLRKYCFN